ncbi:MAG: HAMP domain-containing sensor histidine kinase, partial [Gillisia sp.]
SDRLNRLIDKILDLEKFESGKQKIYPSENDIIETILKAVKPLQQLLTNKNITFKFNDTQSEVLAFYDEERIIQVITNLLSNSIKFCGETRGLISISVSKNDDILIVDVFNNGKSINTEDLDAIFEKFYQSSDQNIKKPIGSGLGLAICKQIIEVHKGKISAANEKNGVRFSFVIPANYYHTVEQE